MFMFVGRDFFPIIDGGQIQLHVRAPAGTRIEKTEQIFQAVEDKIREVIPEDERDLIVDNIGLPARSYNYAFGDGTATGLNDGVILVSLKEDHAPTAELHPQAARGAAGGFPECVFYFQAADMVTQILNFGISGANQRAHRRLRSDQESAHRQGAAAAYRGHPGRRRRASAAGGRRTGILRSDRPGPRHAVRSHGQRHCAQSQHQPEFVRADLAELLDRSEQRHAILYSGADARIPGELAERAQEHAGDQVHACRTEIPCRDCSATSPRSSAIPFRPTPTRPTSSRFTRSMPTPMDAISAASQATSTRSWPSTRSNCRPATASKSSARSTA